jgi:hypothetical protein
MMRFLIRFYSCWSRINAPFRAFFERFLHKGALFSHSHRNPCRYPCRHPNLHKRQPFRVTDFASVPVPVPVPVPGVIRTTDRISARVGRDKKRI